MKKITENRAIAGTKNGPYLALPVTKKIKYISPDLPNFVKYRNKLESREMRRLYPLANTDKRNFKQIKKQKKRFRQGIAFQFADTRHS